MKHFIIYTVQVHVLRSFVHLCMCERLFQGLFTEDLYLQMDIQSSTVVQEAR